MFKKLFIALLAAMACVHAQEQVQEKEKDITEIDPNFRQATVGNREVRFADVRKAPFVLTGFAFRKSEDEPFYRIPTEFTKEQVNGGVLSLAKHPSGGAVLFRTNSPFIALLSDPPTGADMNHMPATGVSGYDLYERLPNHKERFISIIRTTKDGSIVNVGGKAMRDYIIFLPLYSSVNKLEVGVAPDATFEPPTPQRLSKPIVFYGSSITQGGCCSRPGNNYTTMICRALDVPQVNLGFSGSARGETAMAEAIAQIDAAMFVYDYDHNAPSLEHLQKTQRRTNRSSRSSAPPVRTCRFSSSPGRTPPMAAHAATASRPPTTTPSRPETRTSISSTATISSIPSASTTAPSTAATPTISASTACSRTRCRSSRRP